MPKLDPRIANADSLTVGGGISESRARLIVFADDINLDELTQIIGCQPTLARRKGERNKDYPKRPPARTGMWVLESPKKLEFEEKIHFILKKTVPDTIVWKNLILSHVIQLYCGIFLNSWNEDFILSRHIISEIAKRCWEISFDIYSADGEDIIAAFLNKDTDSPKTTN